MTDRIKVLRKISAVFFFLLLSVSVYSQENQASENMKKMAENLGDGIYVEMNTDRGVILLALEYEKVPMTVMNFTGLAEGKIDGGQGLGKPFYDGLKFHRVIDNFMIQGGDPRGNGTGGPNYKFPDEFDSSLKHSGPGVLSMANSGPNTNGSQFFITHVETPWLDGHHTVFGHVVKGQDVVNAIRQGDKIVSVKVIRVGKKAEAFKNDDATFKAELNSYAEKAKAKAVAQRAADEKYVGERWPDAVKTESGLRYIVQKKGTGTASPKMGQKVVTHYQGKLLDGRLFDSSYQRGQALEFCVGQVIEGWNEALMTMKKGEKRTLIIPPELGYGEYGAAGVIPPNAYLIFEVELIDF